MNLIESFILAVVQGITEFLPISSSAHLIFTREILGIGINLDPDAYLAFDVALHLGTLVAILAFFSKDFKEIAIDSLTKGIKTTNGKIGWFIVAATVPAAIAGLLFEDVVTEFFRSNYILISIALIVVGFIIFITDKHFSQKKKVKDLTFRDVMFVGFAQMFALIPGFSRSGTTIAAARSRGIKREDAAKFSFYLSVPVTAGAIFLMAIREETMGLVFENLDVFVFGIIISFVTGILVIKYLLIYLKKHDFEIFMWYRLLIGFLMILLVIF